MSLLSLLLLFTIIIIFYLYHYNCQEDTCQYFLFVGNSVFVVVNLFVWQKHEAGERENREKRKRKKETDVHKKLR